MGCVVTFFLSSFVALCSIEKKELKIDLIPSFPRVNRCDKKRIKRGG
jgi:hypothetical protein